jgi:hypothetical protein
MSEIAFKMGVLIPRSAKGIVFTFRVVLEYKLTARQSLQAGRRPPVFREPVISLVMVA